MDDIRPSVIKIGMVHSLEHAHAIADILQAYPQVPVVLDPVMVATSGDKLIEENTIAALKSKLFSLALIVTPNLDEAQILSGMRIHGLEDMQQAARIILETGCRSVLLKGGHLKGTRLYDVYLHQNGDQKVFESVAIDSRNTHGTGCTFASAIASALALGHELQEAVSIAKKYIHEAIEQGKDVRTGEGHGPLNHFYNPQKLLKHALEPKGLESKP